MCNEAANIAHAHDMYPAVEHRLCAIEVGCVARGFRSIVCASAVPHELESSNIELMRTSLKDPLFAHCLRFFDPP
jgi:hypothetical protein